MERFGRRNYMQLRLSCLSDYGACAANEFGRGVMDLSDALNLMKVWRHAPAVSDCIFLGVE